MNFQSRHIIQDTIRMLSNAACWLIMPDAPSTSGLNTRWNILLRPFRCPLELHFPLYASLYSVSYLTISILWIKVPQELEVASWQSPTGFCRSRRVRDHSTVTCHCHAVTLGLTLRAVACLQYKRPAHHRTSSRPTYCASCLLFTRNYISNSLHCLSRLFCAICILMPAMYCIKLRPKCRTISTSFRS